MQHVEYVPNLRVVVSVMVYTEGQLVLPALGLISSHAKGLTTSNLSKLLRRKLAPSGRDLELLSGRADDRFSQKVRNLTGSHRTLEKRGFAIEEAGYFKITEDGRRYLDEKRAGERGVIFDSLSDQGFGGDAGKAAYTPLYGQIVIEEGATQSVSRKVYSRSQKLTRMARDTFADAAGCIACVGCGFEGTEVYGEVGLGLIEIHHLRPLYISSGATQSQSLKEALDRVAPLCPNCHRLVHSAPNHLMAIEELRQLTGYAG